MEIIINLFKVFIMVEYIIPAIIGIVITTCVLFCIIPSLFGRKKK